MGKVKEEKSIRRVKKMIRRLNKAPGALTTQTVASNIFRQLNDLEIALVDYSPFHVLDNQYAQKQNGKNTIISTSTSERVSEIEQNLVISKVISKKRPTFLNDDNVTPNNLMAIEKKSVHQDQHKAEHISNTHISAKQNKLEQNATIKTVGLISDDLLNHSENRSKVVATAKKINDTKEKFNLLESAYKNDSEKDTNKAKRVFSFKKILRQDLGKILEEDYPEMTQKSSVPDNAQLKNPPNYLDDNLGKRLDKTLSNISGLSMSNSPMEKVSDAKESKGNQNNAFKLMDESSEELLSSLSIKQSDNIAGEQFFENTSVNHPDQSKTIVQKGNHNSLIKIQKGTAVSAIELIENSAMTIERTGKKIKDEKRYRTREVDKNIKKTDSPHNFVSDLSKIGIGQARSNELERNMSNNQNRMIEQLKTGPKNQKDPMRQMNSVSSPAASDSQSVTSIITDELIRQARRYGVI